MAASAKTKPMPSAAHDLASLKARRAELAAAKAAARQEGIDIRAGASALALQPEAHHAQFVKAAAADERAKLIDDMIAQLEPQIAQAEKREALQALGAEARATRTEGLRLAQEWREGETVLVQIAALFERVRSFDDRRGSINRRLREARRLVAEMTLPVSDFEEVGYVLTTGGKTAESVVENSHIEALASGQADVWAGRRVRR